MANRVGMDATHTTLTVAQAAETLGVSERTVWRYLKAGRLEGHTVGEIGSQRTLIASESVDALRGNRGADPEAFGMLQAPGGRVAVHDLLQARLVNRDATGFQDVDFFRIDVHAHDMVAHIGQTRARDQSDVTGSYNADLHAARSM